MVIDKTAETPKKVEKISPEVLVVGELPTQPVNRVNEEGIEYDLITVPQALTKLLKDVEAIKKAVA